MMLPVQMTDRWRDRREDAAGEGTVYWHMLMKDQPRAAELAREAQQRLAPFAAGLHLPPPEWLHMTTLVAGPARNFTAGQLQQMARTAASLLTGTAPVAVTLGRILYHPEAIMLAVTPASALQPVRDAAAQATRLVTGSQETGTAPPGWAPHITICYSTCDQPAQPLINSLGLQLPSRDIQISSLSLVVQHGPERSWDWEIIDTIHLGQAARA
jgi:2'-5' RNA ligase